MPAKKKQHCPKGRGPARKSAMRDAMHTPPGAYKGGKAPGLAKGGALHTLVSVGGVVKPNRGLPVARAVQGMAVPVSWAARPTKTG